MKLKKSWKKHEHEITFNISNIPERIKNKGIMVEFAPKSLIVSRGQFPKYIYFIYSGTAIGIRDYEDGNEYDYFQIDKENGNIGLLEILARKEQYIASIMCITPVRAIKIESYYIYDLIMSDITLLRRCTVLLANDLYMRSGNDGILYYLKGLNKIKYYLVNYYDKNKKEDENVILYDKYEEIANKTGISVRTVGRNIKQLKDSGQISSNNKKIIITKKQYEKMLTDIKEKLKTY